MAKEQNMRLCKLLIILSTMCLLSSCSDAPVSGEGSAGSVGSTGGSAGGGGSTDNSQIIGQTYYMDIEDSDGSLSEYGSYRIIFGNGTYDAPGDYYVSDSHGTYTIRINGDQMTMSTNDHQLGRATWLFTYDAEGTSGTYVLTTTSHGTQEGRFTTASAVRISTPIGAG